MNQGVCQTEVNEVMRTLLLSLSAEWKAIQKERQVREPKEQTTRFAGRQNIPLHNEYDSQQRIVNLRRRMDNTNFLDEYMYIIIFL